MKPEHEGLPLNQLRMIYGMTPEMQEWLDAINDTGRIGVPVHAKALVDRLAERGLIRLNKTGSIWVALSLGEAASSGETARPAEAGNSDAGSGINPGDSK